MKKNRFKIVGIIVIAAILVLSLSLGIWAYLRSNSGGGRLICSESSEITVFEKTVRDVIRDGEENGNYEEITDDTVLPELPDAPSEVRSDFESGWKYEALYKSEDEYYNMGEAEYYVTRVLCEEENIGKKYGTYINMAVPYERRQEGPNAEEVTTECNVYEIQNVSPERMVAVKVEEKGIYLYCVSYTPPDNMDMFWEEFGFEQGYTVEVVSLSYYETGESVRVSIYDNIEKEVGDYLQALRNTTKKTYDVGGMNMSNSILVTNDRLNMSFDIIIRENGDIEVFDNGLVMFFNYQFPGSENDAIEFVNSLREKSGYLRKLTYENTGEE